MDRSKVQGPELVSVMGPSVKAYNKSVASASGKGEVWAWTQYMAE